MAWRAGRVVLNDTPLGDAVAEFERYFDTGLVVPDPAVAALRLNGSFDLRQAGAFKRALPEVLPVRLQTRADGKTEVRAVN
jgi:transmembrane sensor